MAIVSKNIFDLKKKKTIVEAAIIFVVLLTISICVSLLQYGLWSNIYTSTHNGQKLRSGTDDFLQIMPMINIINSIFAAIFLYIVCKKRGIIQPALPTIAGFSMGILLNAYSTITIAAMMTCVDVDKINARLSKHTKKK